MERLERSGILAVLPKDDMKMLVDDSVNGWKPIVNVDGWLETDSPFLVMLGVSGCGKTVASGHMIAKLGGVYVHTRTVERVFSSSFGEPLIEQERIKKARYAVVDDLDTETDHEKFKGAFYEIIDARQSKRTIFTSNLNRRDFNNVYKDARIQRRLERAKFVVAKNVGKK